MFKWLANRVGGSKNEGRDLSIITLIKRLADDAMRLVRAEIRLAQAELKANVASIALPVAMFAFGLLLSVAALLTLMGAFVAWLSPLVGVGFAALIVAVAAAAAAAGLMLAAKKKIETVELMPSRAVAVLREEVETLKGQDLKGD